MIALAKRHENPMLAGWTLRSASGDVRPIWDPVDGRCNLQSHDQVSRTHARISRAGTVILVPVGIELSRYGLCQIQMRFEILACREIHVLLVLHTTSPSCRETPGRVTNTMLAMFYIKRPNTQQRPGIIQKSMYVILHGS